MQANGSCEAKSAFVLKFVGLNKKSAAKLLNVQKDTRAFRMPTIGQYEAWSFMFSSFAFHCPVQ